jgi:hypothetical protein
MNARAQSQVQSSPTPSFTPAPVNIVQRKCSCGGSAGLSGECIECQKERLVGDSAPLIQPKLKISQPNDKYEQEADRVADEVMQMPEPKMQRQTVPEMEEEDEAIQTKPIARKIMPVGQRKALDEEENEEGLQLKGLTNNETVQRQLNDEDEMIQAKGATSRNNSTVSRDVQSEIDCLKQNNGNPLPQNVLDFMEPRFDQNFSRVRIHTDEQANQTAIDLQARAFTLGSHIVFGKGAFDPYTVAGRRLLAHELTHSVQKSTCGPEGQIQRRLLTKEERENDPRELKKAKRRTRILRRWLERISEKSLDDVKPTRRNIRRADWVKQLEAIKEPGFESLSTEEKARLKELTKGGLNDDTLFQGEGTKDAGVGQKEEERDDGSSQETEKVGQEEKSQESESVKTESEELEEDLELPSFECAPSPIAFGELNKMSGATGRSFGATVLKKAPTRFGSSFSKSIKLCTIRISKEGIFKLNPFAFVQPGTYRYATNTVTDSRCAGKKLDLHVKITSDMAEKFKQGEIEHCEDYKRAFALSIGRYNKAMRDVKSEGKFSSKNPKSCMAEVKKRVFSKLGIPSVKYDSVRKCLRKKSVERDTKGWHNVNVSATTDRVVDPKCTMITYELDPTHKDMLPELGKHSAKDLVKGCGE